MLQLSKKKTTHRRSSTSTKHCTSSIRDDHLYRTHGGRRCNTIATVIEIKTPTGLVRDRHRERILQARGESSSEKHEGDVWDVLRILRR